MHDGFTAPPAKRQTGEAMAEALDWNLLRTFLAVMEFRSISRAAEALGLKQPTVSNALRRLETQLGVKLIHRGPRRFEPTSEGEALLREAASIYGAISRVPTLFREVGGTLTGQVDLAMATHVVSPLIDETLAEFSARHPKASVSITVAPSRRIEDALIARRHALGVCLTAGPRPELEYRHLFTERFGFFCGARHPLFGRRGLTINDLAGHRRVAFDTELIDGALRPIALVRADARFAEPPAGVSNNLEEVRRMVIAGLGVGAFPIHVVQRDVADGVLWRLPPYEAAPSIDIFVARNPATQFNAAEEAFAALLYARLDKTPAAQRAYGEPEKVPAE